MLHILPVIHVLGKRLPRLCSNDRTIQIKTSNLQVMQPVAVSYNINYIVVAHGAFFRDLAASSRVSQKMHCFWKFVTSIYDDI